MRSSLVLHGLPILSSRSLSYLAVSTGYEAVHSQQLCQQVHAERNAADGCTRLRCGLLVGHQRAGFAAPKRSHPHTKNVKRTEEKRRERQVQGLASEWNVKKLSQRVQTSSKRSRPSCCERDSGSARPCRLVRHGRAVPGVQLPPVSGTTSVWCSVVYTLWDDIVS
jgi:hypothetical protein